MKRSCTTLALLFGFVVVAWGQQAPQPQVSMSYQHVTTPPLRSMPAIAPIQRVKREIRDDDIPRQQVATNTFSRPDDVQSQMGPILASPPFVNFEGTDNVNSVAPPDPVGDVGPNHYVQMVNLSLEIYDKAGNTLFGPVDNNTLWQALGGACASENAGDPIVLYDEEADRWLISQFSDGTGPFFECVGVSATPDPTGAYHLYAFQFSAFPDYPHLGIGPDAYYIAVNQFNPGFLGAGVAAFERDAMLNGDPAQMVFFDLGTSFGSLLPADFDGTLPAPGTSHPFAELDPDEFGAPTDRLRIHEFNVDFDTPGNSTFDTDVNLLAVDPFTPEFCPTFREACIEQPPGGNAKETLSDRLMHRFQARSFADHTSFVVSHAVNVNTGAASGQAGMRWYELRSDDAGGGAAFEGGDLTIFQQGTFAPDTDSRWMGSVAINAAGTIALAYSVSSSATFPSIRFTGRSDGDPLGVMTFAEESIIEGSGVETNNNRWGDYSSLNVDPVTDNFWYVGEYVETTGSFNWQTRIGGFALDPDPTAPDAIDDLTATATGSDMGAGVELEWTATGDDGSVGTASFYDIRFSDVGPITTENDFDNAMQAMGEPSPQVAGSAESFTIDGLDFDTQYWFSVRAFDDTGNASPLSNSPSATTGPAPIVDVDPDMLSAMQEPNNQTMQTLTVLNTGGAGSMLNFSFPSLAAATLLKNTPIHLRNDVTPVLLDGEYEKGNDPHGSIGNPVILGAGGPDNFGYLWIDSNEPGGPTFDFLDISGIGDLVALGDDAGTTVPLPFDFPFYGIDQSSIGIASNGYLGFSGNLTSISNTSLPSPSTPNNIIAMLWDDLNPALGGTIHTFHDDPNNRFIVQFTDVPHFNVASEVNTFQAQLFEDGTILLQYLEFNDDASNSESYTVGIEDAAGTDGLQVAFNTTYLENGLAILIEPEDQYLSVDPAEGTVPGGSSVDVEVTFDSQGLPPGNYAQDLRMVTNDPVTPAVVIPTTLDVAGGTGDIDVDPLAIDFGSLFVGAMATETITISNVGNGDIEVTDITSDNPDFTVNATMFPVPFGESMDVEVSFAPSVDAPVSGNITIFSTDPDEPTVVVTVMGEGGAPPVIGLDPNSVIGVVEVGQIEVQEDGMRIINDGENELTFETEFNLLDGPNDLEIMPDQVAAPSPLGGTSAAPTTFGSAGRTTRAPLPFEPGMELYQLDDGSSEDALGLTAGGDIMWLNAFQVIDGRGTIESISSVFGANGQSGTIDGAPVRFILYEDPNDDGDPTDAVFLLEQAANVVDPYTDTFLTVPIEPTTVEGVFFIAVLFQNQPAGQFPAPLDQDSGSQMSSWAIGSTTAGSFDVNNLGNNNVAPVLLDDIGFAGNWLLRADASDLQLISVVPSSGTVPPNSDLFLDVVYNASQFDTGTPMDVGTYDGEILFASNDPINPVAPLPAQMIVTPGEYPFELDPEEIEILLDLTAGDSTSMEVFTITNLTGDEQSFAIEVKGGAGDGPEPGSLDEFERRVIEKIFESIAGQAPAVEPTAAPDVNAGIWDVRALIEAELPGVVERMAPTGVIAHASSVGFASPFQGDYVSFDTGEPATLTSVGPMPTNAIFAGEFFPGNEEEFIVLNNDNGDVISVDVATGVGTVVGSVTSPEGINDLAVDPTDGTVYATSSTNLYMFDPDTYTATLVGPYGIGGEIMIAIAVDENGVIYGHEIITDAMYLIDSDTGEATLLGPTGVAANFAQSMDYDLDTGTLYMGWYQGGGVGGLRTVDTATGATTLVGPFQGDEMGALMLPSGGFLFIDAELLAGLLAGNGSVGINLNIDARGLIAGTYVARVCVTALDVPGQPTQEVLVTLTVEDDPEALIEPNALDFGQVFVNGTSDSQTVTLTNVGGDNLNVSDVSIDEAAFMFVGNPETSFVLEPGESRDFEIFFAPTAVQMYNGTLTVVSDNPAGDVTVSLTGEGIPAPVIAVDPASFDLQAFVGQMYERTLTITNNGGNPLECAIFEEGVEGPGDEEEAPNAVFIPTLLEEDFEGGIPGDWTIVNNTPNAPWQTNSDYGEGNYTNGSGTAAMACNDCSSGDFDSELRTPSINPGDETALSLSYTVNYQNFAGFDFLDVDISTDGGATWTNLLSWNEDHGGFFSTPGEDVTLDLEPFLTANEEFIVRWRYYDPTDFDFDWYATIDDVVVAGAPIEFVTIDPSDCPEGGIAPGESADFTISIDVTNAIPGDYFVNFVIQSNDPVNPEVVVPFDLTVITDVTVIADTDNIEIDGGGDEVYPGTSFTMPITVVSLNDLEVIAYQFTLTFDPDLLMADGVNIDGTISDGSIIESSIDNVAGTIEVAVADDPTTGPILIDPNDFDGAGTLIEIMFTAGTEELGTSPIAFADFQFNEGEPAASTVDGEVTVSPLYGDASLNGTVNAADASFVLQYVVGQRAFSNAAIVHADVTGNGTVNAADAARILQFIAGMIPCFEADPDCGTSTVASKSDVTVEQAGSGLITWGEPKNDPQNDVTRLPLQLEKLEGNVYAASVEIPVDEKLVSVENVEASLPDGWSLIHHVADGTLRIALAGTEPLTERALATVILRWSQEDAELDLGGITQINDNGVQMLAAKQVGAVPETFALGANYPNPFNPITTISYQLPENVKVELEIYNVLGQKVRTLVSKVQEPGRYKVQWDSRNDAGQAVASGTYIYRIKAGGFVASNQLILIK